VQVGASRNAALSTRSCVALLSWSNHTLTAANNVPEIDIDAFGVDLGVGAPVAAFQIKTSATSCCVEYQLYSLTKPPHVLRSITGADAFSAADIDLDGRVEIWTTDAAAVDGFEGLRLAELDFAPPVVLRFSAHKLLDVSAEFQAEFDGRIASVQKELTPGDLRAFKATDGKLASSDLSSAEYIHKLRTVKAKILEIFWCYLYSGREQQAWRSLGEMWPAGDVARIRAAILSARTHGIISQLDGISAGRSTKTIRHAVLFNAVSSPSGQKLELTPPESILLNRPPLIDGSGNSSSDAVLDLVIDSAGKVRSAKPSGRVAVDAGLIRASLGWKFIPAFKNGRAVACRTRLSVSPKQ